MSLLRDATQVLGYLEGGEFGPEVSAKIKATLDALADAAGPKGKAKGSVTIKLSFELEGQTVEVKGAVENKVPKVERPRSFLFYTPQGLSTEHPKQMTLFPAEVRVGPTGRPADEGGSPGVVNS